MKDLEQANYKIGSSVTHSYCNSCMQKLFYTQSFFIINSEKMTVQRLCPVCKESVLEHLKDSQKYKVIEADDTDV